MSPLSTVAHMLGTAWSGPQLGAGGVKLGSLVETYTEPTCRPRRHGGTTTIEPPARIKVSSKDTVDRHVEWRAWLYRKGKLIMQTPVATAKLRDSTGHLTQYPGEWGGWKDKANRAVKRTSKKVTHPGKYYWVEQVTLKESGVSVKDKLPYYFQPPGSLSGIPGPCVFH